MEPCCGCIAKVDNFSKYEVPVDNCGVDILISTGHEAVVFSTDFASYSMLHKDL